MSSLSLIILFVIWIVLGLVVGYAASGIFKGERPHGLSGDLTAAILSEVIVGLMDWYLIPMMFPNIARLCVFVAALVEPFLSALIVLWLMRYIKNR